MQRIVNVHNLWHAGGRHVFENSNCSMSNLSCIPHRNTMYIYRGHFMSAGDAIDNSIVYDGSNYWPSLELVVLFVFTYM